MMNSSTAPSLPLMAALLALGAASCHSPIMPSADRSYGISETRTDKAVRGRPTFGSLLAIPGSRTRIIPFTRESSIGWFGDSDHFAEGGVSAFRSAVPDNRSRSSAASVMSRKIRWHNAALHDFRSGEQWTLLSERGVLSRYWMHVHPVPIMETAGEVLTHVAASTLIFAATTSDTNGDQRLDDLDEVRALATDGNGRNPRFVTPEGTQLVDVQFDDELNVAILMVRVDLNGDDEFSEDEPPRPFVYELGGDQAKPLLEPSTLSVIEGALE